MNTKSTVLYSQKNTFNVIGIMSGTSLDGIDLAYVRFHKSNTWTYTLEKTETIAYSDGWLRQLQRLIFLNETELEEINRAYTSYLGAQIKQFISKHAITAIDAVCSHGHTAVHQPDQGITLQLGNLPQLATDLGLVVVCDFRKQDVALGGQGAPLVPIGDQKLFSDYDVCVNFGGFVNLTYTGEKQPIAFDIGGFNLVYNKFSQRVGLAYDDEGKLAQSGQLLPELKRQLQQLDYYQKPAPKSLGVEWLEEQVFPLLESYLGAFSVADILHTYTHHITDIIAFHLEGSRAVLCSGGGVYNRFAILMLQEKIKGHLFIPSAALIEYKEALIFGFLGVLRLLEQPNCLASVTGAPKDHSSGEVYFP